MNPKQLLLLLPIAVTLSAALPGAAQPRRDDGERLTREEKMERRAQGGARRDAALTQQPADVAELDKLSVILGRPTDQSVVANIVSVQGGQVWVEYGLEDTPTSRLKSAPVPLEPQTPTEFEITGLQPDRAYAYRVHYRAPAAAEFNVGATQTFHTQRAPGKAFVFELQGDSHPERPQQFDAGLYASTLRAAAADKPDFYIAMGDDFSVDTLDTVNAQTVSQRYRLQRPYLALIGQTAPVFLVNGNHEQAAMVNHDGSASNVAVWAQTARNRWYSQPAPDHFYSGNATPVAHIGLLRNYYAWTWGDALFVVVDPYWHSREAVDNQFGKRDKGNARLQEATKGFRDLWNITLGDAQYRWLKESLEKSTARYKFVFAHHVLGTGRGGVEQASLYEWGGQDRRGNYVFAQQRPGWELPIHQLMVKYGVTIFFQGHDHVFAHQQLDGLTYQTAPQPADPNYTIHYDSAYRSGTVLPSSGRIRVTVNPEKIRVEYVRSYLPGAINSQQQHNTTAYSYEIPAARSR